MKPRVIKMGAGFGDDRIYFTFRALTIAEEKAFAAKFTEVADLTGNDKALAEAKICMDALAEWALDVPTTDEAGENPAFVDIEHPTDAVRAFFDRFSPDDQDRLANAMVMAVQNRLRPQIVF